MNEIRAKHLLLAMESWNQLWLSYLRVPWVSPWGEWNSEDDWNLLRSMQVAEMMTAYEDALNVVDPLD